MLHEVACRDAGMDCDFRIQDENERELIDLVKIHAQRTHEVTYGADDIRGVMKKV